MCSPRVARPLRTMIVMEAGPTYQGLVILPATMSLRGGCELPRTNPTRPAAYRTAHLYSTRARRIVANANAECKWGRRRGDMAGAPAAQLTLATVGLGSDEMDAPKARETSIARSAHHSGPAAALQANWIARPVHRSCKKTRKKESDN